MTAPRPRRQRATRNDVSRYGKNQRRVWKDSVAAHQRLDYLCGALFANDIAKMAFALGVCKRYLNDIIRGHSRLTVRLAAHIVSRLGLRAEWLLCGSGDVFISDGGVEPHFSAWPAINSVYHTADPLFDMCAGVPVVSETPSPPQDNSPAERTSELAAAAQKIFQAAKDGRPVLLWLAETALVAAAQETWLEFFNSKYASGLLLPLSAARLSAPSVNTSVVAVQAAATATGFGETLCQRAEPASFVARVYAAGATVLCAAQIGETVEHVFPTPRPLEVGAAIGAAAYVDWLALTDYLRNFFEPPGGALIVGDGIDRLLPLLQSQRALKSGPAQFSVVVLGAVSDATYQVLLSLGADVVRVSSPAAETSAALFAACNSAYMGI